MLIVIDNLFIVFDESGFLNVVDQVCQNGLFEDIVVQFVYVMIQNLNRQMSFGYF